MFLYIFWSLICGFGGPRPEANAVWGALAWESLGTPALRYCYWASIFCMLSASLDTRVLFGAQVKWLKRVGFIHTLHLFNYSVSTIKPFQHLLPHLRHLLTPSGFCSRGNRQSAAVGGSDIPPLRVIIIMCFVVVCWCLDELSTLQPQIASPEWAEDFCLSWHCFRLVVWGLLPEHWGWWATATQQNAELVASWLPFTAQDPEKPVTTLLMFQLECSPA